jgi:hypothetical protein
MLRVAESGTMFAWAGPMTYLSLQCIQDLGGDIRNHAARHELHPKQHVLEDDEGHQLAVLLVDAKEGLLSREHNDRQVCGRETGHHGFTTSFGGKHILCGATRSVSDVTGQYAATLEGSSTGGWKCVLEITLAYPMISKNVNLGGRDGSDMQSGCECGAACIFYKCDVTCW